VSCRRLRIQDQSAKIGLNGFFRATCISERNSQVVKRHRVPGILQGHLLQKSGYVLKHRRWINVAVDLSATAVVWREVGNAIVKFDAHVDDEWNRNVFPDTKILLPFVRIKQIRFAFLQEPVGLLVEVGYPWRSSGVADEIEFVSKGFQDNFRAQHDLFFHCPCISSPVGSPEARELVIPSRSLVAALFRTNWILHLETVEQQRGVGVQELGRK